MKAAVITGQAWIAAEADDGARLEV